MGEGAAIGDGCNGFESFAGFFNLSHHRQFRLLHD